MGYLHESAKVDPDDGHIYMMGSNDNNQSGEGNMEDQKEYNTEPGNAQPYVAYNSVVLCKYLPSNAFMNLLHVLRINWHKVVHLALGAVDRGSILSRSRDHHKYHLAVIRHASDVAKYIRLGKGLIAFLCLSQIHGWRHFNY